MRLKSSPTTTTAENRDRSRTRPYQRPPVLADGGVYDNLGLETAWKRYTTILVSDGGGTYRQTEPKPDDWARQATRVLGVIDTRCEPAQASGRRWIPDGDREGAYWGIWSHLADYGPPAGSLPCPDESDTQAREDRDAPDADGRHAAGAARQLGLCDLRRRHAQMGRARRTGPAGLPVCGRPRVEHPCRTDRQSIPRPVFRNLRVFAVDPGLTARFETAVMNETTLRIPWEQLDPGPSGEYVVVVDKDEGGTTLNPPVDLDRPEAARTGRTAALRRAVRNSASRWSTQSRCARSRTSNERSAVSCTGRRVAREDDVSPAAHSLSALHGERERATTTPTAGIHFGYFESVTGIAVSRDGRLHLPFAGRDRAPGDPRAADGDEHRVRPRHESRRRRAARGLRRSDRALPALLGERRAPRSRSPPFAATSRSGASSAPSRCSSARAIGTAGRPQERARLHRRNGKWQPRRPDPTLYETEHGAARAAETSSSARCSRPSRRSTSRASPICDASRRRAPGVLPKGYLHPDLVEPVRRTRQPSRRAMCSRCACARLDYLPPVEVDVRRLPARDHHRRRRPRPNDHRRYRVAFVDAFRSYGIGPAGLGTLSVDTLRWSAPPTARLPARSSEFVKRCRERAELLEHAARTRRAWHALEGWRARAPGAAEQQAEAEKLGVIDLTEPFEVVVLRPARAGRSHRRLLRCSG